MSGTGGADVVHGAGTPTPKWWKPFRDIPLIVLAIASLVAALVGWTTAARLDADASRTAPISPTAAPSDGAAAQACRAPVDAPASEPWIDDPAAAGRVWDANAEALAGPVVAGQDGWAFYNDQIEQNFSQAVGRRLLTTAEVASWRDYFAPVADALAAEGIEFTIQVTPSASSVYPEHLPEWAQPLRGSTPLDQFLAAMTDLPIIDLRADLRAAAADNAVFTPVNSHWTDWGGYVGWQSYARCHDALHPTSTPITVPEVSGVSSGGIFNEYASYGIADAVPEWTSPDYVTPLSPVTLTDSESDTSVVAGGTSIDLPLLPASTENEEAWSDQTALILRDSMGNALSALWSQQYTQTWQIQHRYDDWSSPPNFAALVEQYHPDVVIVQLAERHLVNAPGPTITSGY